MNLPCRIGVPDARADLQPARRHDAQLEPEDVEQQLPEPEDRHRHADDREEHRRPAGERVAPDGRQDADGDPQHQPDACRADAERDRDRETASDLFLDGDEVAVRVVHVLREEQARPGDEPFREPRVLDPHRLVQAERPARVRDLFGGGGLARRAARGIAGRQLHEDDERQQRDDEQDQHHEEGSAHQVPAHVCSVLGVGADALAVPCRT